MSSASHEIIEQHEIVRHDLTVSQLYELLKHAKFPAHSGGLEGALDATKDGVATDADWAKFFTTVNSLTDVPVISSNEEDDDKGSDRSVAPRVGLGTVVAIIGLVVQIAGDLWKNFHGIDDKDGRSRWTQQLVQDAWNSNPGWNYVVVYTRHSINFDGQENVDWARRTYRYKLRIGYMTYTLYTLRGGVFSLLGDGGFLNWAYTGRVVSADPDSVRPRRVVFRAPE